MTIRRVVKENQKRRGRTTSFRTDTVKVVAGPQRGEGSAKDIPNTVDKKNVPSYMKKTTKASASKMDGNAYTPTQLKPVGPNMGRDARKSRSDGQSVPGSAAVKKKAPVNPALVSKNTPSGVNRMDKKKPKVKKKSRGLVTMTSMQNKYL
jgi:hypothetical protein